MFLKNVIDLTALYAHSIS